MEGYEEFKVLETNSEQNEFVNPEAQEVVNLNESEIVLAEVQQFKVTGVEEENPEDPFAENSEDDPNYLPSSTEDSDSEKDANNGESSCSKPQRKRKLRRKEKQGRKRSRSAKEWVDAKSKRLLDLGLEHENRKGKVIKGRQMSDTCKENCRLKCSNKISHLERKIIFENFWKLGNHTRQWDFLARHVKQSDKKQITVSCGSQSRRKFSRAYYLQVGDNLKKVCKVMFLHTLGISETWVSTALKKIQKGGALETDNRGRHTNRPHTIQSSIKDSVRNHINMFPLVPSHYVRKDSSKMYLEEGLSIQKMFRLYLNHCKESQINTVATARQYRDILNTEFNIGFFKPKKDQCDYCSVYNFSDDKKKADMQKEYEYHIKNKIIARELKNSDKNAAISDKSLCVACFDLQKVLPTPQSHVSDFYYKSKYSTLNFTIYDIGNNEGYCYVWHEQIARRGSNEISSCLWKFIKAQVDQGIKKIIFYSDNCSGQNRNRFVFSMMAFAAIFFKIDITHRFLEKGHTQNEGDSMHAVIENAKKRQSVLYVPEQWVTLIRMSKTTGKPYSVTEMSQDDFYNFKILSEDKNWQIDNNGKPLKISTIREINYYSSEPNNVSYKYELDSEEINRINTDLHKTKKTRGRQTTTSTSFPPKLYNSLLPIEEKKLKGLLWLCNTGKIPAMYHAFYKSLKSTKSSLEQVPDYHLEEAEEST